MMLRLSYMLPAKVSVSCLQERQVPAALSPSAKKVRDFCIPEVSLDAAILAKQQV